MSSHRANIIKIIEQAASNGRYTTYTLFTDFVNLCSISFSNAVDIAPKRHEAREQEYLSVIKKYQKDEYDIFPKLLSELTLALEEDISDVLGYCFQELNLSSNWHGQFFTPDDLSRLMAKLYVDESLHFKLDAHGFVTLNDPAIGAGSTIIAFAHSLKAMDVNYQRSMHVVGMDIDIRAIHMTYLQFCLLHIPAVLYHMNTLTNEKKSEHYVWYTPAHVLDGWFSKLRRRHDATSFTLSPDLFR